jgi:stress response protein SCP2
LSVATIVVLPHADVTVIVRSVSSDDGFSIEHFLIFLELENHSSEIKANKVMNYMSSDCKVLLQ